MTDLWFEVSDGASMDQEKATLLEFRHLLDERALGCWEAISKILILAKALRRVAQLIRGRTDVSFRFIGMVNDGADAASSPLVEIKYTMAGPLLLKTAVDEMMATVREGCLAAQSSA